MTRRVVFAGGIQAKALATAYRLDVTLDRDEDVYFVGGEALVRDAAQRVVAAADVLVTDLSQAGQTVPDSMIRSRTLKIIVPVVDGGFLWPYAAGGHPRNEPSEGLPDGPYPAGFGDSILDGLVADGLGEDEAVSRYLDMDIGEAAGLDERLRATIASLAALDAVSGFDLAPFIAANFRTQILFTTRDHLALPLFRHVGWCLFRRMGIASDHIGALDESYFPPDAMPIHPGVLRHFGMATPEPGHRYAMLDEGAFTFEQFCHRYVRFEWNRKLHTAIAMAAANPSDAIPVLRLALETSPDSVGGLRALKEAERAISDYSLLTPLALPAPATPVLALPAQEAPTAEQAASPPFMRPAAGLVQHGNGVGQQAADAPHAEIDHGHAMLPPFGHEPPRALSGFAAGFRGDDTAGAPLVLFSAPARPSLPPVDPADEPDGAAQEQQSYVELPLTPFGPLEPQPVSMPMARTNRYAPLAPAQHLISLLPRMLPNTRGMAGSVDRPFAVMPETMPPPPLRPLLPPELHPEPLRSGLVARLMAVLRK